MLMLNYTVTTKEIYKYGRRTKPEDKYKKKLTSKCNMGTNINSCSVSFV